MKFDFTNDIHNKATFPCTREAFYNLVQNPSVMANVVAYRAGDAKAKAQLPAFLFQATFEGGRRGDVFAIPSGLYLLDFDHLQDPPALAWEKMQANARGEELGVKLVHVTPSGQGLRVVATMLAGHDELQTIAMWQEWLHGKLDPEQQFEKDPCVKDFSRLSFVVPLSEFLYLDDTLFAQEPEAVVQNPYFGKNSDDDTALKVFTAAAATPAAHAASDTSAAGSGAPCGAQTVQVAGSIPMAAGIDPKLVTDYLPKHVYKPSGRHGWWVRWGQYLKYKGVKPEALPAYKQLMASQLMLKGLLQADDPLYRNPREVDEAFEWAYEHTESEILNEEAAVDDCGDSSLPTPDSSLSDNEFGITDADRNWTYNGVALSEIADAWVVAKGAPHMGETYTFYYDMAMKMRYICDYNARVMFAQLPDFGMVAATRMRICTQAANRTGQSKIPYAFYSFLIDHGFKKKEANDAGHEEVGPTADEPAKGEAQLPKLPPLLKEFCDVAPADFREPLIFALLPVLGTLATRIRAYYIDGEEHSPSATTVIYAPQSSGKSFVRRLDRTLLGKLRERDRLAQVKEQNYKKELAVKKNAKVLPEDPQVLFRIIEAVISVPQLCSRQMAAQGLHQFTLLEELDTLTKSNKGGSWADKSDLYRVAYDNGYYGQDYKNSATFSGSIRLFYNLLICGTPNQVTRFFTDAENGLVSRVCFCPIRNQQFCDIPVWKPFSEKQQAVIRKVSDRLDALTYGPNDEVKPTVNVNMDWLFAPLQKWLRDKLKEAEHSVDVAMDAYRKRAAVNAFRYGMICTQLYARLDKNSRQVITDFCLWFAEHDLRNRLELFADKFEYNGEGTGTLRNRNLFDALPERFNMDDVKRVAKLFQIRTAPTLIIHLWHKNQHIMKDGECYIKLSK